MITDDPWVFCYVCVCQDNGPHYFWLYTYIHTQYPGKKSSQIQHGYLVRAREFFLAVEIMTMSNYRFLTVLSGAGGRDMVKGQAVPPDIHVDSTWTPPPQLPCKKHLLPLMYYPSLVCYREQRQKEATKMATATAVVNSFPKDRDYRREVMQAAPTSFTPTSEYQPMSYLCSQSFILSVVGFKKLLVTLVTWAW